MDVAELRGPLAEIAAQAAQAILEVYARPWEEQDIRDKADDSPLTEADVASHRIITAALPGVLDVPIVSEEGRSRDGGDTYWLVDPLDGTKEFIKRNGEFTVNIALINGAVPVAGVVQVPVSGRVYFGADGKAWRKDPDEDWQQIQAAHAHDAVTAVVSKSHRGEAVDQYLRNLQTAGHPTHDASFGSSLKLCKVAEGAAHIYPRLGPTMPWDTAAAHAVVDAAGGTVTDLRGRPLRYDDPGRLNPWFLAGGPGLAWHEFAAGIGPA